MNITVQSLVTWFIVFEFFVVIALVIAIYMLRFIFLLKNKRDKRIEDKLKAIFTHMEQQGVVEPLSKKFNTHLLLEYFINWDKTHQHLEEWQKISKTLMKLSILPLAVKYINSRSWSKRFWLLQCLEYYIDISYENILICLIKDKFSVVSISATSVAMNLPTEPVLMALINTICFAQGQFQTLYIAQLKPSPILYELIGARLKQEKNPHYRQALFHIITEVGVLPQFYHDAIGDITSSHLELKLAAIRIIAAAEPKMALPWMLELITDPNWIVRNTVIKSMAYLDKDDVITVVAAALYDPAWWVRINAAKLMAQWGEDGHKYLPDEAMWQSLQKFQLPMDYLMQNNTVIDKGK